MRLLSYNIRHGGAGREREIAAVVRAATPDLAVLQEATVPEVVERVAREAGMAWWAARPGHSLAAVASRAPASFDWKWMPSARHAHLELRLDGFAVPIVGVHLRAIHSNWTELRRTQDVAALLRHIEQQGEPRPVLVGDFNTLAPAEPLNVAHLPWRLRPLVWLGGGAIRWRVVEQLKAAGYHDGYRLLHADATDGFTFPAWNPHLRLDYVFVPDDRSDMLTSCEVPRTIPESAAASDHFPLLATLAG